MSLAFGFALPHWQAISGGFSPASLFAGGTVAGAWYDPSDLSTMFDSSAGTTPVAMPGQGSAVSVGLMLDKSQGLVLGPELVDTANNASAWIPYSTNTVVQDGDAVKITYVDNSQGAAMELWGAGGLATNPVVGKRYLFTFEAKVNTGSVDVIVTLNFNDAFRSLFTVSSTTYVQSSFIWAPDATTGAFMRPQNMQTGEQIWIRNISVRELPGNHAIAFNNTTARPELRARVNLLTYSEQFDNAAWVKNNVTITANAAISPDGTTTADKLIEDNTYNRHFTYQQPTLTSSAYSYTVYAKAAERSWLVIDFTTGANTYCWFNLSNGTLGTVDASRTASISDVGNGWYRCTVTAASISGGVFTATFVSTGNNVVAYTGDGTSGIYIWGADLRPANIGANVPAYQRIADANTYDTSGFPLYLLFEGAVGQRGMYTPANLNLSGTDKVSVFAGVRKLSDAAAGMLVELSADWFANNGAFALTAPDGAAATYGIALRGSNTVYASLATFAAPITNVVTQQYDIGAATVATEIQGRVNGANVALSGATGVGAGTGYFGTYPLYIGSRNNSSLWFQGQVYGLVVVGSAVSAGNISATEQWVAGKTGIAI